VNSDVFPGNFQDMATGTNVQCLLCGAHYAKPNTDRTATANPGCPRCGYLGWLPAEPRDEQSALRLVHKR